MSGKKIQLYKEQRKFNWRQIQLIYLHTDIYYDFATSRCHHYAPYVESNEQQNDQV